MNEIPSGIDSPFSVRCLGAHREWLSHFPETFVCVSNLLASSTWSHAADVYTVSCVVLASMFKTCRLLAEKPGEKRCRTQPDKEHGQVGSANTPAPGQYSLACESIPRKSDCHCHDTSHISRTTIWAALIKYDGGQHRSTNLYEYIIAGAV